MRDDFAKVLVERPRHGHHRSFGEQRHRKDFKDNELYFGGRESMKKRYDSWTDRKSFNEHLNPLKGWLRSVVGKPWDKSYSELREKFDARSTINNHILEHLWDYVETHAFVEDGKVMCQVTNIYGAASRTIPIKQCYSDYYVCPKDGTLKIVNKAPKRAVRNAREIAAREAEAKIFRVVNEHQHLHFIDGVWFVFEVKNLPLATIEYRRPAHYGTTPQLFKRGWMPNGKMVEWDQLSQSDRERYGSKVITGMVTDAFDDQKIYRTVSPSRTRSPKDSYSQNRVSKAGSGKYYVSKFTASHKVLKEAGLDGTAAANDDMKLSHREASKYRRAA
jgi:hypothetical protein